MRETTRGYIQGYRGQRMAKVAISRGNEGPIGEIQVLSYS